MSDETVIKVNDVHKSFKLFYDKGYSLKEVLLFSKRRRYEKHDVLRGVSFDVKKGEAVGLIGHNGCGKSTMLKLLTRIMYPDSGTIEIKGRVSSLIELGAGFHPDMSGRENIFTNASIFGLSRKEIEKRLKKIIDFSEIEEFIDNPVRTYSSGMYMRLAFSVAINVDADILLIDEILAVGDVSFQNKCFNRLKEIKANGTTIVIVSHSLGQIEQICDRSIWINDGLIKEEGDPRRIHMDYYDFMINKMQEPVNEEAAQTAQDTAPPQEQEEAAGTAPAEDEKKRWGNHDAVISSVRVTDKDHKTGRVFKTGSDIIFEVDFEVRKRVEDAVFGIGIFNRAGVQCYGTNTRIDAADRYALEENGRTVIHLKNVSLLPGEYLIDIAIESGNGIPVDYYREVAVIEMVSPIHDVGVTRITHTWQLPDNRR